MSKALKNSAEIGRDTKDKIQAFAKLYNYKPNNIAISLKNKRTRNIGVIIPDIVHHFFTTVFRGIEKHANTKGYNVIVCVSDESFDKEVINMEMLANGSIDGFIMALAGETQSKEDYNHLREVTEQGIPLVLFDRVTDEIQCDKVIIDDETSAYQVVKKLIKAGRKRIALITTEGYLNVSAKRAAGYYKALKECNLPIDKKLVLELPYQQKDEIMSKRFFEDNKVDAVLCVNEIFAIKCMGIAQKLGYLIPEDIAFVGFTDGILSHFSSPGLTSVDQHGEIMGETAAQMLIEKIERDHEIEEEEVFETKIIAATLIERASTPRFL